MLEGVAALKRGDLPAAESKLRAEIEAHPDDVEALSFLGVALDEEKKFAEADSFHRRALAPRSNSILDKYASHLLVTDDEAGARKTFLNALTLDSADGFANLQLAQMALMRSVISAVLLNSHRTIIRHSFIWRMRSRRPDKPPSQIRSWNGSKTGR
jgi:Flp pilus assembly protein TadD